MKKLAVIIFGEYRTFDIVQKFWHFPKDVDLWISTWNQSEEERISWVSWNENTQDYDFNLTPVHQGERVRLIDKQIVSNENFLELRERNPNTKIFIRHVSEKPLNSEGNTPNMIYHWIQTLNDMKNAYSHLYPNLSDVYDGICGLRIDSIFHFDSNKIREDIRKNPNALYSISDDRYATFFNDMGFHGSVDIIDKWISTMSTETIKQTHYDLGRHTVEQGIEHINSGSCFSISVRFGAIEYFKRLPNLLEENSIDITNMTRVAEFCEQDHLHNIIRSFTSRHFRDTKFTLSNTIREYCDSIKN